jgi:DNA-binding GntR family transcriptional regulator
MVASSLSPRRNGHIVSMRSAEHASRYIRELIFDGQLAPGSKIPQDDIARALGVSRIPLREALIALEREGWVTLEMHRGAFVNVLDEQAVRDHYDLFGLLYAFSVQRAMIRSGPELGQALGAIATRFRKELDTIQAGHIVLRFHATVVEAAHSPRTKVLFRAMSTVVPGDFFEHVPNAVDLERKSIPLILRAIRGGHPSKAAAEYTTLMRHIGDEVVDVLRARGLFASTPLSTIP